MSDLAYRLASEDAEEIANLRASLASAQQRIEELERALGELVAVEDFKDEFDRLATRDYLDNRVNQFTEMEIARYRFIREERSRRLHHAWAAARALVARAIGTREGGDAPAAPGRSPESAVATATRPSEAFLRGISPQSAWPFAQDDKGSE